jgi:hypothetical protein
VNESDLCKMTRIFFEKTEQHDWTKNKKLQKFFKIYIYGKKWFTLIFLLKKLCIWLHINEILIIKAYLIIFFIYDLTYFHIKKFGMSINMVGLNDL